MQAEQLARHLVFRHDHARRGAGRAGPCLIRRINGTWTPNGCEPLGELLQILAAAAVGPAALFRRLALAIAERLPSMPSHPFHEERPASFVIAHAEHRDVGVTAAPAGALEAVLVVGGAREVPEQLVVAELRLHLHHRRQPFVLRAVRQRLERDERLHHDVRNPGRPVDLHAFPLVRLVLERLGDAKRVFTGLQGGELEAPLVVRVDRGANVVRCDQLHHESLGRVFRTEAGLDDAGGTALHGRRHRPLVRLRLVERDSSAGCPPRCSTRRS